MTSALTRFNNNTGMSLFDDLFRGLSEGTLTSPSWRAISDRQTPIVKHLDDRYEISLAAPGVEKKDFIITVEGDKLTLAYDAGEQGSHYAYASNYSQSYTLPNYSDVENISASYKNGVLVVSVPKTEAATARVIKVK